jgi:hypothetical protein
VAIKSENGKAAELTIDGFLHVFDLLLDCPATTIDPSPSMTEISKKSRDEPGIEEISWLITHLATSCPSRTSHSPTSGFCNRAMPII